LASGCRFFGLADRLALSELTEFLDIEDPAKIEQDRERAVLEPHRPLDVFARDLALDIQPALNLRFRHTDHFEHIVHDAAQDQIVELGDHHAGTLGLVTTHTDTEFFFEVDRRDHLASQVDQTLEVGRDMRNGGDLGLGDHFLHLIEGDCVVFLADLKDQVFLGLLLGLFQMALLGLGIFWGSLSGHSFDSSWGTGVNLFFGEHLQIGGGGGELERRGGETRKSSHTHRLLGDVSSKGLTFSWSEPKKLCYSPRRNTFLQYKRMSSDTPSTAQVPAKPGRRRRRRRSGRRHGRDGQQQQQSGHFSPDQPDELQPLEPAEGESNAESFNDEPGAEPSAGADAESHPSPAQPSSPPYGRHRHRHRHRRPEQQQLLGLEQRTKRHFPRRAQGLGEDYFRKGHVSAPTRTGDSFQLFIQGNGATYSAVIDFSKVATEKRLEARCDCPYYESGGFCKHLWAAVLKIDKAGMSGDIPETGPLRVVHVKPRVPGAGGNASSPPAVTLPRPLSTGIPMVSTWRARLDQIQGITGGRPVNTLAGTWVAFFVINAAETISSGKLVVDLWTRDRLTSGSLGPLKPGRVSDDFQRFSNIQDREILSVLTRTCAPQTFAPFGRGAGAGVCSRFAVEPLLETHLLPSLTSANKLFLSRSPNGSPDDADRPLRMDRGTPWTLELNIEAGLPDHYRLGGWLKRETELRNVSEPLYVFSSGFLLFADRIGRLGDARQVAWLNALRSPEDFLIPRDQGDLVVRRLLTDPAVPKVSWPDDLGWSRMMIDPRPKGVFRPLGNPEITGRMTLTVSFEYEGREITLNDTSETLIDIEQKRVYARNFAFEEQTLAAALKVLRDEHGTGTFPVGDLQRVAGELTEEGWIVFFEQQRLRVAQDFAIDVASSTDWFDLTFKASFDGSPARRAQLLAALQSKDGMIRLEDGSLGMLPSEMVTRYASMGEFAELTEDGGLRFNRAQGLLLSAALGQDPWVRGDKGYLGFKEKIAKFEGVKTARAPRGFKGTLRNYQKEGLSWLDFVDEFEMGGVLADDMGLGKTIQILAFLARRPKKGKLPSIVVAPKSLVFNWLDEAARFVPDLNVVAYAGPGRAKLFQDLAKADLVVTTYGAVRTDIDRLQEIEFDVAIVDEAQAIKNPESKSALATKRLRSRHQLALTGTPIENSLTDLFSILEFTSPGLLNIPKGKELGQDGRQMLSRMLKPFVLRRTKEKVLTELPEKTEQVLYCEMSTEERETYASLRDHYREALTGQIEKQGLGKSKLHVLEALLRLRQASCHPALINSELKGTATSAKLELLLSQIQEVVQEGHKALVFSQFTSLLSLVRADFDKAGITYEYLDGETVDRKSPVERFQTDPKCQVFIISLKAGGTGLNLTAADYVFILDPWWNPAVEAQAIGRAHRMGQTQKVFAYRMIARGTVEEKILELQKTKRELAESLFSEDEGFLKKLTKKDLELLLS
jgi:superfamily II DNA or RNA helicase